MSRSPWATGRARDDRRAGGGAVLSRAARQRARAGAHARLRWRRARRRNGCRRRRSCSTGARWIGGWMSSWRPMRWFLGVEMLVFGRARDGRAGRARRACATLIRIRRGGRLLLHDAIRLERRGGATLRAPRHRRRRAARWRRWCTSAPGCGGAAGCGARRAGRDAGRGGVPAPGTECWWRVSWPPMGRRLRAAVVAALARAARRRPLPRVWLCLR